MPSREVSHKHWSDQQTKGVAGLALLSLFAYLLTAELPFLWAILLGAGQTAGLVLAATTATCCYYTLHSSFLVPGSGDICSLCQLPQLADSHHCPICQTCVPAYSHHSEWLSSCIGAANALSYIGCLVGLALAANCQAGSMIGLLAVMINEQEVAVRINEKYSLRDGGYLFQLTLFFSLLVSCCLVISSCLHICLHISKGAVRLRSQRLRMRRIHPTDPLQHRSNEESYDTVNMTCKAAECVIPNSNGLG